MAIEDDVFKGVENHCRLTNPVPVTGMDAMLCDAHFAGEGESYSYRLMILRVPAGLAVIEDGAVNLLTSCEPASS